MDLNQFIAWQKEKPTRIVEIRICKAETRVWVWDDALLVGQFVKSVDEIDLEAQQRKRIWESEEREKRRFESLKKKYEGVN